MEALGLSSGTVVTAEKDEQQEVGGRTIRHVPLWRWLLEGGG
jgi:predicted AAA+ superfamily ATPase